MLILGRLSRAAPQVLILPKSTMLCPGAPTFSPKTLGLRKKLPLLPIDVMEAEIVLRTGHAALAAIGEEEPAAERGVKLSWRRRAGRGAHVVSGILDVIFVFRIGKGARRRSSREWFWSRVHARYYHDSIQLSTIVYR